MTKSHPLVAIALAEASSVGVVTSNFSRLDRGHCRLMYRAAKGDEESRW